MIVGHGRPWQVLIVAARRSPDHRDVNQLLSGAPWVLCALAADRRPACDRELPCVGLDIHIRLIGAIAAWPRADKAQQARNLCHGFSAPRISGAFKSHDKELREGGYVDGETIKREARYGIEKPATLAAFAEELVGLKVDVIVAVATSFGTGSEGSNQRSPNCRA
jgi:hypothetical protein